MITSDLELLRRITELTPTFIAYIDANERYTHVNSYYTKRMGLTRDQILGRQVCDILGAETYARLQPRVRQALEGENVQFDEKFNTPGGEAIYVSVNYTPDFDPDGKVRGFIALAHDITEKHSIEQKLRQSREQLEAILRNVSDGITVLDQSGRFVFANEAAARLCGFSSVAHFMSASTKEIMERFELLDEERRPFPHDRLPGRLALSGVKNPPASVVLYRDANTGEERYSLVSASPVFDEYGKTQFAISVFRDFTDRIRAEEATRESEKHFRALAETLPQIIWTTNKDGELTYANARLYAYTGSKEKDTSRNVWQRNIHPEDQQRILEVWQEARETESSYETECRIRDQSGIYRWFLVRSLPIYDAKGKLVSWFGTSTDIDAQKRSEEATRFLAESTKVLGSSLDYEITLKNIAQLAVPGFADWCAVDFLDESGKLRRLAVSHTDPEKVKWAYELYERYPPDQSRDSGVYQVLRSGKSEWVEFITHEMLAKSARDPEHLKIITGLGLRSYIAVPLMVNGQTKGVISFILAESNRSYREADLLLAKELGRRSGAAIENAMLYKEAQAAVRLRDEFLSIASHELRTPLTSLYLHLQLLDRTNTGNPETARRVALTTRQAQRLGTLIDSLLDVSRFTNGKLTLDKEDFELISVVQEIVSRLAPDAKAAGSTLSLSAPDLVKGKWDKLRIEQVCTNLISNAIKYGRGNPVEVRITKDNQHVRIAVIDQGQGVAPEDQERIFQRFERVGLASNSAGGLGLGLYIADQIMRAHGGRIRLESAPAQGSTFTAELPLT